MRGPVSRKIPWFPIPSEAYNVQKIDLNGKLPASFHSLMFSSHIITNK